MNENVSCYFVGVEFVKSFNISALPTNNLGLGGTNLFFDLSYCRYLELYVLCSSKHIIVLHTFSASDNDEAIKKSKEYIASLSKEVISEVLINQ